MDIKNKNSRIIKLEPKPVKIEGSVLDLKNRKAENKEFKYKEVKEDTSLVSKKEDNLDGFYWTIEEVRDGNLTYFAKFFIFLLLIIALGGIIVESPIMLLTFLLFAIVFYTLFKRGSSVTKIEVNKFGIIINNEKHFYNDIKSFWIFYDPPVEKYLSIEVKSTFSPFLRIKLENQNPVRLREFLLNYVVEKEHPVPLLEIIMEKFGL